MPDTQDKARTSTKSRKPSGSDATGPEPTGTRVGKRASSTERTASRPTGSRPTSSGPTSSAPTSSAPTSSGAIGIDIGGSGIKGAPVDLETGQFAADRIRIPTPRPATPEAIAPIVAEIVERCGEGCVGVTFPAVVQHGVARSAANVDNSWIGTHVESLLREATGRDVVVVNDADAAGVAEARWGAAKGKDGVVIMTTLGTGIGSALLVDGRLVPNTELGHLEIDGHDAESRAAESAREREDLSWKEWAERLQRYYTVVENLLWPDLFVVGGGVSKKHEKFLPLLDIRTPILPATLRNAAGIVGAAALAMDRTRPGSSG